MKQRLPRYTIFIFVIISVVSLLWWLLSNDDSALEPNNFAAVSRATIEETVTAQGKLEPKEFVDVGAQISGQLQKIHIKIGDTVKKGQLIAEIDPQIYQARVQADDARIKTLRAQLAEQDAQADFAASVYQRNLKLISQDAVSRETLEASLREYKAAIARTASFKAQLEEAQSQRDADQSNLGFTKIYAPIDGTVVSQTSKEGQTLNANQSAPVIVQVANLDTMTVRAQVAEADVARLKEGMQVYFMTLGSARRWNSSLRQLLPSPDATVLDVVLYNALVDVENTDHALMTGMSTQMFFLLGREENALVIPAQALGQKLPATPDQPESYEVRVKAGNDVEIRTVQVGLLNRTQAQIISGLKEGDQVVVPEVAGKSESGSVRRMPRI
jgi:macrolide-specific efflux system membrane fusion protein